MSDDRKPFGIGPIRLPSGNALTCSLCGEKVGECIHTTELQHGQKLKLFAGVLGEGLDVFVDMSPIGVVGELSWEDIKRAVERVKEIARETNQPIIINCGRQEPLLVNEPADRTGQEEE
jgi:hypothetical protein